MITAKEAKAGTLDPVELALQDIESDIKDAMEYGESCVRVDICDPRIRNEVSRRLRGAGFTVTTKRWGDPEDLFISWGDAK